MRASELLAAYERLVHDLLHFAVETTEHSSEHWERLDALADRWEELVANGPPPLQPISISFGTNEPVEQAGD